MVTILSEETKKVLNELTREEIGIYPKESGNRAANLRAEANYGFYHELLWYGIDAVAHAHLMQLALDVSRGSLSLEEFIKKYSLVFDPNEGYGSKFRASLKKIGADGIYIPDQAYWPECKGKGADRKIPFFNPDYINRIKKEGFRDIDSV